MNIFVEWLRVFESLSLNLEDEDGVLPLSLVIEPNKRSE